MKKNALAFVAFCSLFGCSDEVSNVNGNTSDSLSRVDTLVVINKDTIVIRDTIHSVDTLFIKEGCQSEDTTDTDGRTGLNISCQGSRLGTIWNGDNGKSAYEIAVEKGFEGSEEEWVTTMVSGSIFGQLTDSRDGQTYKTVTIAGRTWMAENLRYVHPNPDYSVCPNGDSTWCSKYGLLYMTYDDIYFRKEQWCPEGWNVPSRAEWTSLLDISGGKDHASNYLKSKKGWKDSGNGVDYYGLNITPNYVFVDGLGWKNDGEYAVFLTLTRAIREFPTENNEYEMLLISFKASSDSVLWMSNVNEWAGNMAAIRCIEGPPDYWSDLM